MPPRWGVRDQGTTVAHGAGNGVTADGCFIQGWDIPRRPGGAGRRAERPNPHCGAPVAPHHTQVVHEAGAVLPDLGRAAGQRLHADLLAAVELLHGGDHGVDSVKQQGRGQLGGGGRRAGGQRRGGPGRRRDGCEGGREGKGGRKEGRGTREKRNEEEIRALACCSGPLPGSGTAPLPQSVQVFARGRQGWRRLLWDWTTQLSLGVPTTFKDDFFFLCPKEVANPAAVRNPQEGDGATDLGKREETWTLRSDLPIARCLAKGHLLLEDPRKWRLPGYSYYQSTALYYSV